MYPERKNFWGAIFYGIFLKLIILVLEMRLTLKFMYIKINENDIGAYYGKKSRIISTDSR